MADPPAPRVDTSVGARRILLTILLTVGTLAVLLWGADLQKIGELLGGVGWLALVPLVGLQAASHVLRAWRFGLLVGAGVGPGRMFAINAIGFLAITVLPFRLGELVRPGLLVRDGVPLGQGLAGALLERLFDLAMILALLSVVAFGLRLPFPEIVVQGVDVVAAGQRAFASLLVAGLVTCAALVVFRDALVARLRRLPVVGPTLALGAQAFIDTSRRLVDHPGRAAVSLGLSVGVWGLAILQTGMLLRAFEGVPETAAAAAAVWGITAVGMVVVPTPAGIGAYEAACVGALLLWDTDADVARAFAVVLHGVQAGSSVVFGLPFLAVEGVGLGELVRARPAADG